MRLKCCDECHSTRVELERNEKTGLDFLRIMQDFKNTIDPYPSFRLRIREEGPAEESYVEFAILGAWICT